MQITQSKSQFVEKTLRDKEGRLVRATFCVYENGGRVKARLVSVVYLDNSDLGHSATLALSGLNKKPTWTSDVQVSKYVSPFIQGSSLYFSGSKPRAPTF